MVRVFNSVNNNRELIKGMSNEVLDLQFAHMKSIILLGCIEQTALHVHKIEDTPEKVQCTLMVKIEDPIAGHVPLYDKIKWCPFVPEGEDEVDEYVGQQLVWFRGNVYQCYSIKTVVDAYGVCCFALVIGYGDVVNCSVCLYRLENSFRKMLLKEA